MDVIGIFLDMLAGWWAFTKSRRRVRAWLHQLNAVQKRLLQESLRAAKTSRRRIFEWRTDPSEPVQFEMYCAPLLFAGAVTVSKYAPADIRRFRFQPWLYHYLNKHPELLEESTESPQPFPDSLPGLPTF